MPFTIRSFHRIPVRCTVTDDADPFPKLPLAYCSGFGLLMTILELSSGPAYGEWVLVGEPQSEITVYADPATIRRNGDLVKMWHLSDFTTVQTVASDSYLSSKAHNEYDCAEERTRELAFTWFSGNMGSGNVVYSNSAERSWEPVAPHSVDQALWEIACSK